MALGLEAVPTQLLCKLGLARAAGRLWFLGSVNFIHIAGRKCCRALIVWINALQVLFMNPLHAPSTTSCCNARGSRRKLNTLAWEISCCQLKILFWLNKLFQVSTDIVYGIHCIPPKKDCPSTRGELKTDTISGTITCFISTTAACQEANSSSHINC